MEQSISDEELQSRMFEHKSNCQQAFHRDCAEFVALVRHWIQNGNRPPLWWNEKEK
jgi:hypothetical protein